MSQKGQPRSMYWVFTLNNPQDDQCPTEWPDIRYVVWQKEKGEQGTEHLQGYVTFVSTKRVTWLKAKCDQRAHWETRKGTHDQAKAYSKKEESRIAGPWEHGEEPSGQGKRQDLLAFKRKLDEGATEKEIAASGEFFCVWAKYPKLVSRYRLVTQGPRRWQTFTQVYFGPSGIGKTWRAEIEGGEEAYWLRKPGGGTVWWDGYDGQEVVIIDEFYGWIPNDLMCRICDRYPLSVETKGGSTPFLAKKIIITSNKAPLDWWPKVGLGAMARRLQGAAGAVELMVTPWTPPVVAPQEWDTVPVPTIPERTMEELQVYFDSLLCDEVLPEPGTITPQADCPVGTEETSDVPERQEAVEEDGPRFYLTVSGDHWVDIS